MKTDNKQDWNFENSYTELPHLLYTKTNPIPVTAPELVLLNDELAISLGMNAQVLQHEDSVAIFAGNKVPAHATPLAQAYAGHQFGNFTMLGDGRAVLLGEHMTPQHERFDIQLKGAGRTPYSRGGDGRATLGPMLREYIISEAFYGLGIPTTRSLAVVTTGERVMRETALPGAILTRVADSHIRVGTFQYVSKWGTAGELQRLADYTIVRHFPDIEKKEDRYLLFLEHVMKRQAKLIANWQLVGFVHGVMNTDNMTISGEGIDYGPCAFMDTYHPATVFSSIDHQGRYAYGNQPLIAGWNLARFAETLLPLLHENRDKAVELAQEKVSSFTDLYRKHWLTGMRKKLGLFHEEAQDEKLINDLLGLMKDHHADYTNTFRALTFNELDDMDLFRMPAFAQWHEFWQSRLHRQKESKSDVEQLMKESNPAIIPRNHRVEEALEAAVLEGDFSVIKELLHTLKTPYAHTTEQMKYVDPANSTIPYRTFCGT